MKQVAVNDGKEGFRSQAPCELPVERGDMLCFLAGCRKMS